MQAVKLGSLRSFTQSFFPVNAEIPLLPPTGWWDYIINYGEILCQTFFTA